MTSQDNPVPSKLGHGIVRRVKAERCGRTPLFDTGDI